MPGIDRGNFNVLDLEEAFIKCLSISYDFARCGLVFPVRKQVATKEIRFVKQESDGPAGVSGEGKDLHVKSIRG